MTDIHDPRALAVIKAEEKSDSHKDAQIGSKGHKVSTEVSFVCN